MAGADAPAPARRTTEEPATAPGRPPAGAVAALVAVWAATRTVLLLYVFRVIVFPGPDVTGDVSVIYRGWSGVLRTGVFPADDVTWQYPPAAALPMLAPRLLPFLDYASAFFVLVLLTDAVVFAALLRAGRRPGRRMAGAWAWVAGVALLGPTGYARYDLMVTAVAVGALLAAGRHPRVAGALVGFGALLKVWPLLLLAGTPRGLRGRRMWDAAAITALALAVAFTATMPGALAFLTFQRDRGTEVESLGALVFHVARYAGWWEGQVALVYGSVEFLGPYVPLVSRLSLGLTALCFAWLLLWRLRARDPAGGDGDTGGLCDTAFTAVLLFTVTSRVISPQYMVWLVGLAAVCLTLRTTRQGLPAVLVLAATGVTVLEFPVWFAHVVASDALGIALLVVRNGLLVAAAVLSCRALWRAAVTAPAPPAADGDADARPASDTPGPAARAAAPLSQAPPRDGSASGR